MNIANKESTDSSGGPDRYGLEPARLRSGRNDQLIRRIANAIGDPAGPRVVLVLGAGGSGLSTLLKQVCQEVGEQRCWYVAAQPRHPHSALGGVVNNFRAFRSAEHPDRPFPVLAIDDAQWIDVDTFARLASSIRSSADTGLRCVCTVRVDVPAIVDRASLFELVNAGLVDVVWLRPLGERGLAGLIADRMGAEPTSELLRHVGRLTRNRPKAVGMALDALSVADGIRVVDQRAHLLYPDAVPTLPSQHWLLRRLRSLGATKWLVAKAAAVLNPLGDAMPALVAEATGLPERDVTEALNVLRANGIVRYVPDGRRWIFRLPLVRHILISQTGPYERRRLAQVAVTAVWAGRARCTDPDYLADQQACAGRMLDEQRAKSELLSHARAAVRLGRADVGAWLRAAAELSRDEAERVEILWECAQLYAVQGKSAECLAAIESLLTDLAVQPGSTALLVDIHLAHISMLRGTGHLAAVARVARGESWPWPAHPVVQTITRAAACYALGQWQQVRDLLAGLPKHEDPQHRAQALDALAALWQGEPDRFTSRLVEPDQVGFPYTGALLTLGDLFTAQRLLARGGGHTEKLALPDQAVLAARRGEFDRALALARSCLVHGAMLGSDTSWVGMIQSTALILLARGQLRRARDLVNHGYGGGTALIHLLAVPQARVAMALGEHQQADHILNQAIKDALDGNTVAGTDELWFTAAQLAVSTQRRERVELCLREADVVASKLATDRAIAHSLLIRAAIEPQSGAAALYVARELGQPFDLAMAIEHLVRVGAANPQLLREAYDSLGQVDALLIRARMRTLMREHDVAVPDRQAVVEENERLLAVLVAQGFGNQQIAALLGASRRSIESRLTRLFSRSGYRSRLELAMAMLRDRPDLPLAVNAT
jgi:tetratricopeptide (TPR) repeat protein